MFRKLVFIAGITMVCLVVGLTGCQKKLTKIPPTTEPVADTTNMAPVVDTSDNASFTPAILPEELARMAREVMQPIHFDFNQYVIGESEAERLSTIGKFMLEHPTMRILIEGNCDEQGSSEYNMGLGERRAQVAKTFLEKYGVAGTLIEITSFGKEKPIESGCTTDECHAKNRRDEFKVLSQ
jgi:peptidoglycan-associated lipoprotein